MSDPYPIIGTDKYNTKGIIRRNFGKLWKLLFVGESVIRECVIHPKVKIHT